MKRYLFPLALLASGVACWLSIGAALLISAIVTPPTPTTYPITTVAPIGLLPTNTAPPPTGTATLSPTETPFPTALVPLADPILSPSPTIAALTDTPLVVLPSPTVETLTPLGATPVGTGNASACSPPAGWVAYSVSSGDTLFGFQLGSGGKVTVDDISAANCLKSKLLSLGQIIYLPPGVAENSPKIDDVAGSGTLMPAGLTRTAHCPCTLTIHAGWRLEQIAAAIDKIPVGFTGRDFLAVTSGSAAVAGFSFLSGRPAGASLEGFIFPTTYTLDNATTAQAFRDQTLRAFDAAVPASWRSDATAHGLTFYQVIALASIVQRESYAASEQVKIASVFYNVMAAGKALTATPTVQYIIGAPGNWWPKVGAAALKNRSRYNTYIWLGVPPTPIANPDASAINATIHPAQTDYQYFSADCDGPGNFYTVTYEAFAAHLKHCAGG